MAQSKTPAQYIAAIEDPSRRADIKQLFAAIKKAVPQLKPYVEGSGIGFGRYHYRYASGRSGEAAVIGLSSRARYISVYVMGWKGDMSVAETYRDKLPTAKIGKCCITFKRFSDIDEKVLVRAVREGAKAMAPQII